MKATQSDVAIKGDINNKNCSVVLQSYFKVFPSALSTFAGFVKAHLAVAWVFI
jgi:hypothetical protein